MFVLYMQKGRVLKTRPFLLFISSYINSSSSTTFFFFLIIFSIADNLIPRFLGVGSCECLHHYGEDICRDSARNDREIMGRARTTGAGLVSLKISDHLQSCGYGDDPWKAPGPPLLVPADFCKEFFLSLYYWVCQFW